MRTGFRIDTGGGKAKGKTPKGAGAMENIVLHPKYIKTGVLLR